MSFYESIKDHLTESDLYTIKEYARIHCQNDVDLAIECVLRYGLEHPQVRKYISMRVNGLGIDNSGGI